MERRQQEAAMEAVLFAMGESVEIGKLAEVIEEDEDTARQIINEMKEKWEKEGRGVSIAEFEDSFQMCTRGDLYEYLIRWQVLPVNMCSRIPFWKPYPLSLISSL